MAPEIAAPAPPADIASHFRLLVEAVSRGDWRVALDIGQALPSDYPGVAPIVQRARDAEQQRQDLYNAIHQAYTEQDWALVSRLASFAADQAGLTGRVQGLLERRAGGTPELDQGRVFKLRGQTVYELATK